MSRPVEALKSFLVGRPKETALLEHERVSKTVGLAVFASDNLSSSAYATEEMLAVLVLGGAAALTLSIPVALALVAVVAIIAFSYRGTIYAYPSGGGAYIVAHDNLGKTPGLVAAAALLIDYVLTVSVSIAAGVASVIAVAPGLNGYRVGLSLVVIWLITVLNLRGMREAGRLFAVPTYAFIVLLGGTIIVGLVRHWTVGVTPVEMELPVATRDVTLLFVLPAFARGSSAVTGIEAISNGIPMFRQPSARNAATTMAIMASLLGFLFLGITLLSNAFHIYEPTETRTLVGRIVGAVWGQGPVFVAALSATALILFLAANTSYAGFPGLSAILARDRFWPRQFMNRGDRLAFSNGIIGLAVFASVLVVIFEADVSRLINLYVIGVFTALTFSQAGMIRYWIREKAVQPRWRTYMAANSVGALATTVVLVIVLVTRFTHGGWMVVCAIPVLVWGMNRVRRHYAEVGSQLRLPERRPKGGQQNHVVLLVGKPSKEEARAFWYAERIRTDDFHAVHFEERSDPKGLEARWTREIGLLPTAPSLEVLPSNGSLARSVRSYVERLRGRIPRDDFVTVIVSERIERGALVTLGTRTALVLKTGLLLTPDVVVTNVPYLEGDSSQAALDQGPTRHVVVVLVSAAHNATLHALEYAKTLSADEVHAVHVALDPEMTDAHLEQWAALETGLPLEVVDSPYRRLGTAALEYVRTITSRPDSIVTVILPEFVVGRWWQRFLHNQNAFDLKSVFLPESDVIVTSVPYHLERATR
jgi:amino acid transporter